MVVHSVEALGTQRKGGRARSRLQSPALGARDYPRFRSASRQSFSQLATPLLGRLQS